MSITDKPDDPRRTDSPSYRPAYYGERLDTDKVLRHGKAVNKSDPCSCSTETIDTLKAELAAARRLTADVQADLSHMQSAYAKVTNGNAQLWWDGVRRACDETMTAQKHEIRALKASIAELEAQHECGFKPGDPIQKTGGDYDADAKFICSFQWQGVTRFVGAIPQKRGFLFFIFNPRQVTPGKRVDG